MKKGRKKGDKGKQGQAPIPSRDQIVKFIVLCDNHPHSNRNKAILLAFFSLGLRPKECSSLKMGDVYDFDSDQLHEELVLKSEYTKRGKIRTLPLSNVMLRVYLNTYIQERKAKNVGFKPERPLFLSQRGSFTPNSIGNLMNELLEKRFKFHRGCTYSGRRFFATSLHENGVGMKTIQVLMGHESILTTQRYVEASIKQKREAVMSVL